jgi:hypothetical protein
MDEATDGLIRIEPLTTMIKLVSFRAVVGMAWF